MKAYISIVTDENTMKHKQVGDYKIKNNNK